ncbi:hypothetical protein Agub_g12733, partial [Astrephomene gubernaculifera]
ATASALLCAARPPLVPYMGDEALEVCMPAGARRADYSLKAYLELYVLLRDKARGLQQQQLQQQQQQQGQEALQPPPQPQQAEQRQQQQLEPHQGGAAAGSTGPTAED